MAKPDSADPIARESTRLTCAAVNGAQTSLDPRQLREWMPNMRYGGHAFGFRKPGDQGRDSRVPGVLRPPRRGARPGSRNTPPTSTPGPGDPPVFLDYPSQDKPARFGEEQKDPTHSAVMGLTLEEKLKESGDEAHLSYPGHKDPDYASITDFLIAKLKGSSIQAADPGIGERVELHLARDSSMSYAEVMAPACPSGLNACPGLDCR